MKNLCIIALVAALFFTCSRQTVGTETEVNTGSIFGQLRTDGKKSDDTATVYLYCDSLYEKPVNPAFDSIQTVTYDDGIYQFDSLPDGLYHIEVLRDDIIIGNKSDVEIINDDIVEVNIELSVIINQTFNIWTDQSQHITINNVTINNGRIEKSDSGYVLTSIKTDTLVFTIEITREDDTDTVHVRIIRNGDGTVSFEIVENDVEIIVVDSGSKDRTRPGSAGRF